MNTIVVGLDPSKGSRAVSRKVHRVVARCSEELSHRLVDPPGGRPHPVRYTVDGERVVCFGDRGLALVPDGGRVSVSIHEIAGGPSREAFSGSLRRLALDAVDMDALAELLAHVPLGRTLEEVQACLDEQRAHRRVVELVA